MDPRQMRDQLLATDEVALDRAQQAVLDNLLKARRQLLTRLNDASDSLIQEQTRLKLLYSRQNSKIDEIRELSASHLFWMPDVRPLTPAVLLRGAGGPSASPSTRSTGCNAPGHRREQPHHPHLRRYRHPGAGLVLVQTGSPPDSLQPAHSAPHRQGDPGQVQPHQPAADALPARLLPLPAMVLMVRGLLDGAWQYPFAVAVARGLGEIWFLLLALLMARHHAGEGDPDPPFPLAEGAGAEGVEPVPHPLAGDHPEFLRAGHGQQLSGSTPSTTPSAGWPSSSAPSGCCCFSLASTGSGCRSPGARPT